MTTNWYYDTHGFVNLILSNNGNLDGHGYTRDAVGNIVQETVNGATFTYGLDDLYRLSSATVMGTSYSWSYDLAGNRTQQIAGGVTTNYTYNAADRLATVNGTAVSHDANGQVTADETGGAYTWDVRGRLSGLTRNGVSASFLYDQDDLRISKTVGSTTTSYLLDGDEVVRETTGGTPTDLLQGPGTDNLLERGGNWLLHNGLDSTSAVVNGSGSILQYYYYAPFGQLTMQGGGSPQPYQFTGREADETGLMYYRARYYNPGWGRFVSEDPIGVAGAVAAAIRANVGDRMRMVGGFGTGGLDPNADTHPAARVSSGDESSEGPWLLGLGTAGAGWTLDLYAYAADNPVNRLDPSGKRTRPSWVKGLPVHHDRLGDYVNWPKVPGRKYYIRLIPALGGGSDDDELTISTPIADAHVHDQPDPSQPAPPWWVQWLDAVLSASGPTFGPW